MRYYSDTYNSYNYSEIPVLKDCYLGNVLTVVSDRKIAVDNNNDNIVDYFLPDIVSATDYYCFGMPMPGRHFQSSQKYRYGYQNQEEDQELWGGAVNFKHRVEDPRLGRFFSRDPLADDYPWNSPYAFSENRVIDGLELEGLEVILVDKSKDATIYNAALKQKDSESLVNVTAHGNPILLDGGKYGNIKTAKQFDDMMKKESPEYKKARAEKTHITVILHSCRTGRITFDKNGKPIPSVAQRYSTIPGVTVIAPDERDMFTVTDAKDPSTAYEVGPRVGDNTDSNGNWKSKDKTTHTFKNGRFGKWNTYKNGNLVEQNKNLDDATKNAKETKNNESGKTPINNSNN